MQKIIRGVGTFLELNNEIQAINKQNILLITGNHFQNTSYLPLPGFVVNYYKQGTNVTVAESDIAFQKFNEHTFEIIIAIGGGSVIDLAKSIIYRCIKSGLKKPTFIAIPTTAGSGSEATHFAVLYEENKKQSWVHPGLLPDIVLLDPVLTEGLSAYQKAVSGMDVLAQAIESYWNVHANADSRDYAVASISIWKEFFLQNVLNPTELSRQQMQWAAHLAGKAINITKTTGPHALSYFLTSKFNIPHGHAVSFFLPLFFLYNKPQESLVELLSATDEYDAMNVITNAMGAAGLAVKFSEAGLNKAIFVDELLDSVNEERFNNNPRPFDRDRLRLLIFEHL